MPIMMFVGNLGYVLVAVIGGFLVTRRSIAIGDVQAFIQYSRQFSMPITQLSSIANTIQLTIASAERVFELLDEPEEPADAPDATVVAAPQGDVQFDHVSFSYKADVPLIEDMSIDVAPGQTIAIVGPTGAGKTTLVNLLMRFYDVNGGSDSRGRRRHPRAEARRAAAHVRHGAAGHVAVLGHASATTSPTAARTPREDAIVQAAKAAQADHFIRTLPENYDTLINEEATNLSQGQKQLLTIARAFLADPAILILDEATSSVDTRTEVLIQKAMAPADARPDDVRHRAPAVDDPQRGPDPDDGARPHRREGHAPRAAGREGPLRRPVSQPVYEPDGRGEPLDAHSIGVSLGQRWQLRSCEI